MAIVDMLPQPGGSSAETLTLLWENDSPTSDFANKSYALSDTMSNYRRVRIAYQPSKTLTAEEKQGVIDLPVEYITRFNSSGNMPMASLFATDNGSTKTYYARGVYVPTASLESLDALYFLPCYKGNNSSTSAFNAWCIPLKIYGIN